MHPAADKENGFGGVSSHKQPAAFSSRRPFGVVRGPVEKAVMLPHPPAADTSTPGPLPAVAPLRQVGEAVGMTASAPHSTSLTPVFVQQTPQVSARQQGPPSWATDLQVYLASRPAPDAAAHAQRGSLLRALQTSPESAEAWWALLQHEQGIAARVAGKGASSLATLFGWATRIVPRQGKACSEAYQQLWIGLACQQWCVLTQPLADQAALV